MICSLREETKNELTRLWGQTYFLWGQLILANIFQSPTNQSKSSGTLLKSSSERSSQNIAQCMPEVVTPALNPLTHQKRKSRMGNSKQDNIAKLTASKITISISYV